MGSSAHDCRFGLRRTCSASAIRPGGSDDQLEVSAFEELNPSTWEWQATVGRVWATRVRVLRVLGPGQDESHKSFKGRARSQLGGLVLAHKFFSMFLLDLCHPSWNC